MRDEQIALGREYTIAELIEKGYLSKWKYRYLMFRLILSSHRPSKATIHIFRIIAFVILGFLIGHYLIK